MRPLPMLALPGVSFWFEPCPLPSALVVRHASSYRHRRGPYGSSQCRHNLPPSPDDWVPDKGHRSIPPGADNIHWASKQEDCFPCCSSLLGHPAQPNAHALTVSSLSPPMTSRHFRSTALVGLYKWLPGPRVLPGIMSSLVQHLLASLHSEPSCTIWAHHRPFLFLWFLFFSFFFWCRARLEIRALTPRSLPTVPPFILTHTPVCPTDSCGVPLILVPIPVSSHLQSVFWSVAYLGTPTVRRIDPAVTVSVTGRAMKHDAARGYAVAKYECCYPRIWCQCAGSDAYVLRASYFTVVIGPGPGCTANSIEVISHITHTMRPTQLPTATAAASHKLKRSPTCSFYVLLCTEGRSNATLLFAVYPPPPPPFFFSPPRQVCIL
ncbi:hypothetical protein LX36DRAFT_99003 [Colletotrichum falcatum]|nr:hypothetical protein LX36DRAFT_99003 [Colletotrichum falcatum]